MFSVPQVNRGEVVYIQTPIESVGWEAMDSMTFSVVSPPTSLDSQIFKIDISYKNTGPEHNTVLLSNTGINTILQLMLENQEHGRYHVRDLCT